MKINPKVGDLKVWHIPQVPGKSFDVPVKSLREARKMMLTLARYDLFQLEHRIKPDYSNVNGLCVYAEVGEDEFDWIDWEDEDGNKIDDQTDEELDKLDNIRDGFGLETKP